MSDKERSVQREQMRSGAKRRLTPHPFARSQSGVRQHTRNWRRTFDPFARGQSAQFDADTGPARHAIHSRAANRDIFNMPTRFSEERDEDVV